MKTTKESILDIVYGVHAVTESLEANTGNKLYIQDDLRGKNVDAIKALAAEKKVSISWTPKKTLSDMTGGAVHQGFLQGKTPQIRCHVCSPPGRRGAFHRRPAACRDFSHGREPMSNPGQQCE